jgi:hypothetical protein
VRARALSLLSILCDSLSLSLSRSCTYLAFLWDSLCSCTYVCGINFTRFLHVIMNSWLHHRKKNNTNITDPFLAMFVPEYWPANWTIVSSKEVNEFIVFVFHNRYLSMSKFIDWRSQDDSESTTYTVEGEGEKSVIDWHHSSSVSQSVSLRRKKETRQMMRLFFLFLIVLNTIGHCMLRNSIFLLYAQGHAFNFCLIDTMHDRIQLYSSWSLDWLRCCSSSKKSESEYCRSYSIDYSSSLLMTSFDLVYPRAK